MARPKKAITLDKQYSVRLTLAEAKWIEREAGRYGLSVSSYLRQKGLKNKLVPRLNDDEAGYYAQLSGMAKNLNQLARLAHTRRALVSDIEEAIGGIRELVARLK